MAINQAPRNPSELEVFLITAAAGVTALAARVSIKQNTPESLDGVRAALVAAVNGYDGAEGALETAFKAKQTWRLAARVFCLAVRDRLKNFLGSKYSALWRDPGWDQNSLRVPTSVERLMPLVARIEEYLGEHAAQEDAGLNLTKAKATALRAELETAMTAVPQSRRLWREAAKMRQAAIAGARKAYRGLRDEMNQVAAADSADWLAVGLRPPAWSDPPEIPANPRATVMSGGKVFFECDRAARAAHYTLHFRNGGEDYVKQGDSEREPQKLVENLPAGTEIAFVWRATNRTGPSRFSAEEKVTVT